MIPPTKASGGKKQQKQKHVSRERAARSDNFLFATQLWFELQIKDIWLTFGESVSHREREFWIFLKNVEPNTSITRDTQNQSFVGDISSTLNTQNLDSWPCFGRWTLGIEQPPWGIKHSWCSRSQLTMGRQPMDLLLLTKADCQKQFQAGWILTKSTWKVKD